jgi:hypothetical protein
MPKEDLTTEDTEVTEKRGGLSAVWSAKKETRSLISAAASGSVFLCGPCALCGERH